MGKLILYSLKISLPFLSHLQQNVKLFLYELLNAYLKI